MVSVREGLGFPAIARNHGVVQGYEPMLGYDRAAPTLRRWRGSPDYRGEFWTARGPVDPVAWSPNRIELRVAPGERVGVNQNPGSWWVVNGQRVFAADRCAELLEPFEVRADDAGRVVLRIVPPTLGQGIGLHVAGVVLAALGMAGSARAGRLSRAER
jgi:hypothetical protein